MKRSDFLKGIGLAGVGSMLPLSKVGAATTTVNKATACT